MLYVLHATITLIKRDDHFIPALLPKSLQDQKDYVCSAERNKS